MLTFGGAQHPLIKIQLDKVIITDKWAVVCPSFNEPIVLRLNRFYDVTLMFADRSILDLNLVCESCNAWAMV